MTTNSKVKQYFKTCFEKKLMIRKGIIAAIACALVLIFSLSFYFWLRDKSGAIYGKNGFWYIDVIWNDGIAFSGLKGKTGAIFAIQSIVSVIMIALFLLVCRNDWTSAFMACAIFGGLFNLFQRAAVSSHMVLDYFSFGFMNFATFNWPDMFVVVGIFGFVISYIVYLVKQDDREFEEKQKQEQQPEKPKDEIR